MVANCGRWFKRKWELTNHIRTHDETMLKCDTCNFTTKLNKQLKEHKKRHEEDLPYECNLCHKRFQYRSGRKRHTDKITNEMLYVALLLVFTCVDVQVVLHCLLMLKV